MTDQELHAKVEEVLKWPPQVRSMHEVEYLREEQARTFQKMEGLHTKAEAEHRNLATDEETEFEHLSDRYRLLGSEIERSPAAAPAPTT